MPTYDACLCFINFVTKRPNVHVTSAGACVHQLLVVAAVRGTVQMTKNAAAGMPHTITSSRGYCRSSSTDSGGQFFFFFFFFFEREREIEELSWPVGQSFVSWAD